MTSPTNITNNGFLNVTKYNTSVYTNDIINNYFMVYDGYHTEDLNIKIQNNGILFVDDCSFNSMCNIENNGIIIDRKNNILYIDFQYNSYTIKSDKIMIGIMPISNDDFMQYLENRSISDLFTTGINYTTYFTNFIESSVFYYDDDSDVSFTDMIDIVNGLPTLTSYNSTLHIQGNKCNYTVNYPPQLSFEPNINNYTFNLPQSSYETLSSITIHDGCTLTIPDGFTFNNPITFTSYNPILISDTSSSTINFSAGLTTASSGGFHVGDGNNQVILNIHNQFTNTGNNSGEPFQIYKNSVVNICSLPNIDDHSSNPTNKVIFTNNNYLKVGQNENDNAQLNIRNAVITNTSIMTVNKGSQMSIM
jgi:hypothetical protein